GLEALPRVGDPRDPLEVGEPDPHRPGEQRAQDLLLVAEVVVERRALDAELAGDLLERAAVGAALAEDRGGDLEDLLESRVVRLARPVGASRHRARKPRAPAGALSTYA